MTVIRELRRDAKTFIKGGGEIKIGGSGHNKWICGQCAQMITVTASTKTHQVGHLARKTRKFIAQHEQSCEERKAS